MLFRVVVAFRAGDKISASFQDEAAAQSAIIKILEAVEQAPITDRFLTIMAVNVKAGFWASTVEVASLIDLAVDAEIDAAVLRMYEDAEEVTHH